MKKIKKVGIGALSLLLATGGLSGISHAAEETKENVSNPSLEISNETSKPVTEKDSDLDKKDESEVLGTKLVTSKIQDNEDAFKKLKDYEVEFIKSIDKEVSKENAEKIEKIEKSSNFEELVKASGRTRKEIVDNFNVESKKEDKKYILKDDVEEKNSSKEIENPTEDKTKPSEKDQADKKDENKDSSEDKKEDDKKAEEDKEKVVDKTKLQKSITNVKDFNEKDYTKDSYKVFKEALDNAKKTLDNNDAKQDDVDKAKEALNKAISELKKAPKVTDIKVEEVVNKDRLVETVKNIKEDLDKYTEDSKKEMNTALENAQAVIDNKDATQEDVDKAFENLENARGKLVRKLENKNTETEKPKDSTITDNSVSKDGKGSILPQTGQGWAGLISALGAVSAGGFGFYKSKKGKEDK